MHAVVCGYTQGCMHMCVGLNVSRYERSAQQKGSSVEERVNDRQRLDKDGGTNKDKGTAGKVGVKLNSTTGAGWRSVEPKY